MANLNNAIPRQIPQNGLREYPGRRAGTRTWICDNNEFRLDRRYNPIWRCKHVSIFGENCPAKIELDGDDEHWLTVGHIHPPDPLIRQELEMREECKRLAIQRFDLSSQQV